MATRPTSLTKPDIRRHEDRHVVNVWRSTDTKQRFDAIMREHDYGTFYRSSAYVDEMLTDDRIYGVTATRVGGLISSPLLFKPSDDRRRNRQLADRLGGADESRGEWRRMVSVATEKDLLTWGMLLGIAVAEIVWDTSDAKEWTPRLVPFHPQSIRWDQMSRRFVMQTSAGETVVLPRPDEDPVGDGKWFVWCPHGVKLGWRRALIRPLGDMYIKRQWNSNDWASYGEKHGKPVMVGKVPVGADGPDKERFFDSLSNLGSEGFLLAPQGMDGQPSYGVEMVEAVAKTYETFRDCKAALDTDIAIVILGQNLTTEVQGGSRAAASEHSLIRIDKMIEDAEIATAFRDQVLTWWALFNFGDRDLAPFMEYQVEPADDDTEDATAMLTLGQAVQQLVLAEPRTNVEAIFETAGIPMISVEEMEARDAVEAEEKAADAALPGADGAPPAAGDTAVNALMRLAARAAPHTTKLARTVAGGKRAAKYEDRLIAKSQKLAARALAVDLAGIKLEIDEATSFDDLKRRIVARFRGMDPAKMAAIVQKASLMGHLSGRLSGIEAI